MWTLLPLQDSKKVQSGCWGQVNLPTTQATIHSRLPSGLKGFNRQVVCQLNMPLGEQSLSAACTKGKLEYQLLFSTALATSRLHSGLPLTREPCFQKIQTALLFFFTAYKWCEIHVITWFKVSWAHPRMIGHSKLFANISPYSNHPFSEQLSVFRELIWKDILMSSSLLTIFVHSGTLLKHISSITIPKHWVTAVDAPLLWDSSHFGITNKVYDPGRPLVSRLQHANYWDQTSLFKNTSYIYDKYLCTTWE